MDLSILAPLNDKEKLIFSDIFKDAEVNFYNKLYDGYFEKDVDLMLRLRSLYVMNQLKVACNSFRSSDKVLIKQVLADDDLVIEKFPRLGCNSLTYDRPIIINVEISVFDMVDIKTYKFDIPVVYKLYDFCKKSLGLKNLYKILNVMFYLSVERNNFCEITSFLIDTLVYSKKLKDCGLLSIAKEVDLCERGVNHYINLLVSTLFLLVVSRHGKLRRGGSS